MHHPSTSSRHAGPRGFTIVELLVVISIIGLLIAILLPAIGKARDSALVNQSRANLRNLGVANSAYWGDYQDRQPSFIRYDLGSLPPCDAQGGCAPVQACDNYQQNYGCMGQMVLGYSAGGFGTPIGALWGIWINGPNCNFNVSGGAATCALSCFYVPMCFVGSGPTVGPGTGAFRLPNAKSFATYLNGKFYDPVFYAPKDRATLDRAERYFGLADEFTSEGGVGLVYSSYCWSPAAMWNQEVFGGPGAPPCNAFKSPHSPGNSPAQRNVAAYRVPSSSQARYPSLKTLMIEHQWLQNPPPQLINPFFSGGTTPWYFNQGYNSNPVCLFFDLSIQLKGVWQAIDDDIRARTSFGGQCPQRGALWCRDTPLGVDGYFSGQAYDFQVGPVNQGGRPSAFHILTRNGISGRDFLTEAGGS